MTRYIISRAVEGYRYPSPDLFDGLPDAPRTECVTCGAPCAGAVCCSQASYERVGSVVHDHPTCRSCCEHGE